MTNFCQNLRVWRQISSLIRHVVDLESYWELIFNSVSFAVVKSWKFDRVQDFPKKNKKFEQNIVLFYLFCKCGQYIRESKFSKCHFHTVFRVVKHSSEIRSKFTGEAHWFEKPYWSKNMLYTRFSTTKTPINDTEDLHGLWIIQLCLRTCANQLGSKTSCLSILALINSQKSTKVKKFP